MVNFDRLGRNVQGVDGCLKSFVRFKDFVGGRL